MSDPDDRFRRLMESPIDDAVPRRTRRWFLVGGVAVVAILVTIVVVMLAWPRSDDDDEPTVAGTTLPPVAPATRSPEPRAFYELAYDPGVDRLVLFGGTTLRGDRPGDLAAGTWIYDTASDLWEEHSAAPQPPPRTGHALAVDRAAGLVVVFGGTGLPATCGVSGPCASEALGDTWVFDAQRSRWSQRTPRESPSPRYGAAMAFDAESEMLILFGGATRSGSAFVNTTLGDTWTYDPAADSWRELRPSSSPPPRAWHRMAYDAAADRILLFGGGSQGGADGQVWSYDADTNTWDSYGAEGPTPRWGAAVAFDRQSRRLVVAGGEGPVVRSLGQAGTATEIRVLDDVWTFDPQAGTWEPRSFLDAPMFWVAAAWDPGTQRTITSFAGSVGSYDAVTDDWTWSEPSAAS